MYEYKINDEYKTKVNVNCYMTIEFLKRLSIMEVLLKNYLPYLDQRTHPNRT